MLILASASPRRQELLQQIGCDFKVVASCAVEDNHQTAEPQQLVMNNALAKAKAVADKEASNAVLGADTVVVLDGKIYGKPINQADARRMLCLLSGKTHMVYTGIALIKGAKIWCDFEKTTVTFSKLTEEEIEAYLRAGESIDKAGAYGVQGMAAAFIERIEGCYTNVVGLPLNKLLKLCKKAGITLL